MKDREFTMVAMAAVIVWLFVMLLAFGLAGWFAWELISLARTVLA